MNLPGRFSANIKRDDCAGILYPRLSADKPSFLCFFEGNNTAWVLGCFISDRKNTVDRGGFYGIDCLIFFNGLTKVD